MINKIKLNPLKGFQFALLGVSMLIAGCGGSTTVADSPDNITGGFSGTVASSDGGVGISSLTVIQGTTTTAATDTTAAATSTSITGSLSIIITDDCIYAISFDSGVQTNTQTILTGADGNLTLTSSNNGNVLSGTFTFLGTAMEFENVLEETVDCPIPQGAANFS